MRKTLITAGLLGPALLPSAAMAQTSPAPAPQPGTPAAPNFMTRLEPGQMLASRIMEEDVVAADNNDIGDVEDVVLDRNGRVMALIVEIEEGLGDRTVALPLSAFQMNTADATTTGSVQTGTASAARDDDDMRIVVTVPVDQLKSAPEFDDDND
jgi:sporulation protein YlmC with PRC-barrel domain